MQFELTHSVRQKYVYVRFSFNSFKLPVIESFENSFARIGGINLPNRTDLRFPSFITSQVISEIIRNTCFICGGLMTDGKALDNTLVSSDDFGNDAGQRGTTVSKVGQPVIKQVRKCISCGHSHT